MKYVKTAMKYFGKHPDFNGLTHILMGLGFGALLTYPLFGAHPVRYGLVFLALGVAGHIWAMTRKP